MLPSEIPFGTSLDLGMFRVGLNSNDEGSLFPPGHPPPGTRGRGKPARGFRFWDPSLETWVMEWPSFEFKPGRVVVLACTEMR